MADTRLFTRLKRLFSTDVVIRSEGGKQLKVVDTNTIQSSGEFSTNSLFNRFKAIYNNPASTSILGQQFNQNWQYIRPQAYSDYDTMDTDAIISSALDIIADECTLKNDLGEVLQIKSSNDDIQDTLYNLFYDVLNIEFNLWSWVRQMCKYGDFFLKLEISEKYGVYNVIPFTAYHIQRLENFNPENPTEIKFVYNEQGFHSGASGFYSNPSQNSSQEFPSFDNYEMAHFRLLSDTNYLPYGRSYLEPARRLYKQYMLMEDAMLIHRIARAPERRIFYINVGNIPPNEIEAYMQKTMNTMKKTPFMDEKTGEYNLRYNMENIMEDYYIPVRGNDSTTKLDTAKGLEYDGIKDVEYLRDKLFAALKVPKAFMGYEKDLQGKSTLAAEDVRFARTIERIQRIALSELNKIALVHLYSQGYKDEQLSNFELNLTSPSIIYDQEKIALLKEKTDLASSLVDNKLLSTDWIYENIFHLSEDQYGEIRDLIREDQHRGFRLDQIKTEGNDPNLTGQSYGTPHDLASLYGRNRYEDASPPEEYDEKSELGRPQEKVSNIDSQYNAFGKDRLGKNYSKPEKSEPLKPKFNGNSPLSLSEKPLAKKSFKILTEELKEKVKPSLLDESNLKD